MAKPSSASHVLAPTIIEFLLDETGSMARYLSQTIGGFSDFLDEQRKQSDSCLFTLTKFDTNGLRTPYIDLDINMVPYLTATTYVPSAGTNLRDAIVTRIDARYEHLKSWDIKPRVLLVGMTDGEDNASQHTPFTVKQKITNAMEDGWTFVYLGAYPQADRVALDLGFPKGNIRCFEGARMRETMQELASATTAYRAAVTPSQNFYS
jgi:hypothetical protein